MAFRLRTLFALSVLLTAVCSPSSNIPVTSIKPNKINPGGGVSPGGGTPDGSVGSLPDGSTGTPGEPCELCGFDTAAQFDAGCATAGLNPTYVSTETGFVCVCEEDGGGTGCQLCSATNPANGGCAAGSSCTEICPSAGVFYLCVATGTTVANECLGDAG